MSETRLCEHIAVGTHGRLVVEECDAVALADRFGTPLYVFSEAQIRENYRRLYTAFASRYPGAVDVLFSTKASVTPAVMRVLAQEGAAYRVTGPIETLEVPESLHALIAAPRQALPGSNQAL